MVEGQESENPEELHVAAGGLLTSYNHKGPLSMASSCSILRFHALCKASRPYVGKNLLDLGNFFKKLDI